MYIITINWNGQMKGYVKSINYKQGGWESGQFPKVFKVLESATRCVNQINQWAPKIEFKIFELKEVIK